MTAIVGLVDKDKTVYIGGDSAGTCDNGDQSTFVNQKVFTPVNGPWFLMGTCGTFRLAQILQYYFTPPLPPDETVDLQQFMSTHFVDALRECFKQAGFLRQGEDGREWGGSFMVGYQGQLFKVEDNFQVLRDRKNYMALGSGECVALGAMFATENEENPVARVHMALAASEAFHAGVRAPFAIRGQRFDENWYRPSPIPMHQITTEEPPPQKSRKNAKAK